MVQSDYVCSNCKKKKAAKFFEGNVGSENGRFLSCQNCRKRWRELKWLRKARQKLLFNPANALTHKFCPRCNHNRGEMVPIERFSSNRNNPDGYADHCLDCLRSQRRQSRKRKKEADQTALTALTILEARLRHANILTPQEVAERLAAGLILDQYPGYWMKLKVDLRSPCWREIRDYDKAWKNILSPPCGPVGTPLFGPPQLDSSNTPTDQTSLPPHIEMLTLLAD